MVQTTRVTRKINGAMQVFYVAVTPDRTGNYQQFTQVEVEKAPTGKFEICESAVGREILREFTPLAEGWTKRDILRGAEICKQRNNDRLRKAFEHILPKDEAALAAGGLMLNGTDIDIQLRGRSLMNRLGVRFARTGALEMEEK